MHLFLCPFYPNLLFPFFAFLQFDFQMSTVSELRKILVQRIQAYTGHRGGYSNKDGFVDQYLSSPPFKGDSSLKMIDFDMVEADVNVPGVPFHIKFFTPNDDYCDDFFYMGTPEEIAHLLSLSSKERHRYIQRGVYDSKEITYKVGDQVDCVWLFKWYQGTIVSLKDPLAVVRLPIFDTPVSTCTDNLAPLGTFTTQAQLGTPVSMLPVTKESQCKWKVGDLVDVRDNTGWHTRKVIRIGSYTFWVSTIGQADADLVFYFDSVDVVALGTHTVPPAKVETPTELEYVVGSIANQAKHQWNGAIARCVTKIMMEVQAELEKYPQAVFCMYTFTLDENVTSETSRMHFARCLCDKLNSLPGIKVSCAAHGTRFTIRFTGF